MKFNLIICIGVLIGLLASAGLHGQETASTSMVDHSRSVVLVRTETAGAGSGVVIDPLYVLTAEHVVANDSRVRVETADCFTAATVVARDVINDVAILKLAAPINVPAIDIRKQPLKLNENVSMLGFAGARWSLTTTTGSVIGIQTEQNIVTWIRVSKPVTHGMSGGPVLDRDGRIVAIIIAVTLEDDIPTNAMVAPNHALTSIVKKFPQLSKTATVTTVSTPPSISEVKVLKK